MEGLLTDILAALAVVLNGIPQGLLALTYGFAALPTAIAFVIGMGGALAFNSVATISFQAETITLAGTMGSNIKERLSLIFWGAIFLLIPSILGLNEAIIDWIGPIIVFSMMAGVGIMLAYVAINLWQSEKIVGSSSMITALIVWFITKDLANTIIISIFVSIAIFNILKISYIKNLLKEKFSYKIEEENILLANEKFQFGNIIWRFWENKRVLIGALSIACLNIGANISFGKITGSIAGVNTNIDHLAIYSSLADIGSSLFGGGPVEAIISGTATAPHPVLASVIMMGIMAVILLLKFLPKIGKFVHKSTIAGFLFVLGVFVTFSTNIFNAIVTIPEVAGGPFGFTPWGMIIGATVLVSARFNPFFGLLSGVIIKILFMSITPT
jgi:AGZA family xanthine/uracil permease-like MFS transporter